MCFPPFARVTWWFWFAFKQTIKYTWIKGHHFLHDSSFTLKWVSLAAILPRYLSHFLRWRAVSRWARRLRRLSESTVDCRALCNVSARSRAVSSVALTASTGSIVHFNSRFMWMSFVLVQLWSHRTVKRESLSALQLIISGVCRCFMPPQSERIVLVSNELSMLKIIFSVSIYIFYFLNVKKML